MSNPDFTHGSLYLAGFTQARAPHAGLIIPSNNASGTLVHIHINHNTCDVWTYQCRVQRIAGDMFMSSLLRLRDVSVGEITAEQLQEAAESIPAPLNDSFGECLPWVLNVVQKLHGMGLLNLMSADGLGREFEEFVVRNQAYARRDRFPNVTVSLYCQ
ncbi:hypothetical protein BKA93DRAFT_738199 [Sparassis latifolia]